MPSFGEVLYAIQVCDTADDVQRHCGISPGRLVDFTKLPPDPEDAAAADPAGGPSEPARNPPPSLANPPLSLANPPPSLTNPSLTLRNGQNRSEMGRLSNKMLAATDVGTSCYEK